MNYIREMNAFYDSLEYNPLSSSAIALWHALMHMNNKTRWKSEFRVAGMVLRIKSGLNESSFKRARTELKEKGYIAYEPKGGNQAPIYRMISLIENRDDAQQVDSVGNGADENSTEMELAGEREAQEGMPEETVTKQRAEEGEVFRFYQENFGVMSPFVIESISDWVDDVGEKLVMEALKRALEQNKTSWGYVKSILQAWEKKGIRSVNAVEAEEEEFRNRKQRRHHYFTSGKREEVIPDWFKEQKEKREKKRFENQNKGVEVDPKEAEITRLKIRRLKEELGYV